MGKFRLQIALPMSNRDNLSCFRRHKAIARIVALKATNGSDLFPSALDAGSPLPHPCEHHLLQPHSLCFPLPFTHCLWEQDTRGRTAGKTKYHRVGGCKKHKKTFLWHSLSTALTPALQLISSPTALLDCAHSDWEFVKGWTLCCFGKC